MPIDQPSMWTSTELHEMMRGFIEAHEKYKHNDIASHQTKAEESPNDNGFAAFSLNDIR